MKHERVETGPCHRCGWPKDHHREGCTELLPPGLEKGVAQEQWQQGNSAALHDNDSFLSTGQRPGKKASVNSYYQLGYLMGMVEK